jgi:hypothetical protein
VGTVYRHLYAQVYDWENLLLAWRKARRGKRGLPPAATFEMNVAENLLTLQREAWPLLSRFTFHLPISSKICQQTNCMRGMWKGPFQRLPLRVVESRPSRCR